MLAGDDRVQGVLVTFTDMTAFRRLQRELEQSHMELETAYEELQSTNTPRTSGASGDEVSGRHLLNLDIGPPVQDLRATLKARLNGETPVEPILSEAVNRRGRKILCQVTCSPMLGPEASVAGAIIVMDEVTEGRDPSPPPA